jgi:hypothetical protein
MVCDSDVLLLIDAMKGNRAITKLDLFDNRISDEGAIAISNALMHDFLPNLEMIDLWGNFVGDKGIQTFL